MYVWLWCFVCVCWVGRVGCASCKLLFPLFPRVASGIDGVDVVVANVSDQASLETMCASTSVLINCVGPVSEVQTCGFVPMVLTLKWVSLYEH